MIWCVPLTLKIGILIVSVISLYPHITAFRTAVVKCRSDYILALSTNDNKLN